MASSLSAQLGVTIILILSAALLISVVSRALRYKKLLRRRAQEKQELARLKTVIEGNQQAKEEMPHTHRKELKLRQLLTELNEGIESFDLD